MIVTVRLIRSENLAATDYAYAATVPATSRLIFLAGACPLDADGHTIGVGDYEAQARAVVGTLTAALAEAGASLTDVVQTRVLVASSRQDDLVRVWDVIRAAFGDHDVPSTLMGVTALGYDDQLVEVEAVAAVRDAAPVPDAIFNDPKAARVYDALGPDRSDLDAYVAIVEEFGARTLLDVGSGTGIFACLLAERGYDVVGVEPAGASIDVAREKSGADRVRWIHGDATALPTDVVADLATMTANVAQVFTTDDDWETTLRGIHAALRPGGHLVFETRIPERRAWERWNRENSFTAVEVPEIGRVESWEELLDVRGELVTFRSHTRFVDEGVTIPSVSTLRFRSREEITDSLTRCGFILREVRDPLPHLPGRAWLFIAERSIRNVSLDPNGDDHAETDKWSLG